MIADDDDAIRMLLKTLIGEAWYEVIEAANGEEALAAIAAGAARRLTYGRAATGPMANRLPVH